ncbi:hypothetical protein HMPREF1548_00796 [Clostridium sp. KLE 1755]|nr:hypothetical protein HMPREF1548_00796 [Clostridium sp. KLE 1755]
MLLDIFISSIMSPYISRFYIIIKDKYYYCYIYPKKTNFVLQLAFLKENVPLLLINPRIYFC